MNIKARMFRGQLADKGRQQIGRDGGNHPQLQWPFQTFTIGTGKIAKFVTLMEKFEIIDLTRTGKIALPRVAGQDA